MVEVDDTYDVYMDEVDETESVDTEETTDSLDAELDDTYDSYMQDKDISSLERGRAGDVDDHYDKYAEHDEENTEKPEKASEQIKCRNENLEGQEHPETGVPFERRQVEVDGKSYEVVVPQFESQYDAQLPEDQYKATDREQFKECNAQLKDEVAKNKDLREQFDEEQLEQIENGDTPDGYTWHHDAEAGKMQLVDTETHQRTGHTGGRSIWGGGTESR